MIISKECGECNLHGGFKFVELTNWEIGWNVVKYEGNRRFQRR